jgi:hypothetical protein
MSKYPEMTSLDFIMNGRSRSAQAIISDYVPVIARLKKLRLAGKE